MIFDFYTEKRLRLKKLESGSLDKNLSSTPIADPIKQSWRNSTLQSENIGIQKLVETSGGADLLNRTGFKIK